MIAKRRAQKQRSTPARSPRGKAGAAGSAGSSGAAGARARGPAGPVGPEGPSGPAGLDHTKAILALQQQVGQIIRELETQLTRIAQIQAQLDQVASGQAADSRSKGPDEVEH